MRPLNYAILKYMTEVPSACAADVINALKEDYGNYKMLKHEAVLESLMTAEANGLLEKERYELDKDQNVHIYYKVTEYGTNMIHQYIK
ncbi:hypothetical protein C817_01253 [Dorea sp. 5-2]|nr:hypothetical protein C817_01253 [Dorea sp. 5-2]